MELLEIVLEFMIRLKTMVWQLVRRRPIVTLASLGIAGTTVHYHTCVKTQYKNKLYETQQKILDKYVDHKNVIMEQKLIKTKSGISLNTAMFAASSKNSKKNKLFDPPSASEKVLIMIPGWGAGYPMFSTNMNKLVNDYDRILTLDLHGFGLSDRTPFKGDAADATNYFVNPIRELIEALDMQESKLHIMGHSLGGYVACEYAYQYPNNVGNLSLVAPVGFDPDFISMNRMKPNRFLRFMSWLVFDQRVSPQAILRFMGPFASRFWDWAGRRANYRQLNPDYWNYIFYNQVLSSGGDKAFIHFLTREGWRPFLIDRIDKLHHIPAVHFIYGEKDYIKPDFAANHIIPKLQGHQRMTFNVVGKAGHHLYYENENGFHDVVTRNLQIL